MMALYSNIRDFIQMHYLTSNRPEPYWLAARNDVAISENLRENFTIWKYRFPDPLDFSNRHLFSEWNYIFVLEAKNFFKDTHFSYEGLNRREYWDSFSRNLEATKAQTVAILPDHYKLLTGIRAQ